MSIHYTQLGHPALLCKDMEKMLDFYVNKLGLRQAFTLNHEDGSPWLTYVQIARGQFVELFYTSYPSDNRTAERSFHHFCIEVDDMAAALERLKERGVEIYSGPADNGRRMPVPNPDHRPGPCGTLCAFIRDPEGNDIELQQFTDKSLQLKAKAEE